MKKLASVLFSCSVFFFCSAEVLPEKDCWQVMPEEFETIENMEEPYSLILVPLSKILVDGEDGTSWEIMIDFPEDQWTDDIISWMMTDDPVGETVMISTMNVFLYEKGKISKTVEIEPGLSGYLIGFLDDEPSAYEEATATIVSHSGITCFTLNGELDTTCKKRTKLSSYLKKVVPGSETDKIVLGWFQTAEKYELAASENFAPQNAKIWDDTPGDWEIADSLKNLLKILGVSALIGTSPVTGSIGSGTMVLGWGLSTDAPAPKKWEYYPTKPQETKAAATMKAIDEAMLKVATLEEKIKSLEAVVNKNNPPPPTEQETTDPKDLVKK
jgi:hypothetical protein